MNSQTSQSALFLRRHAVSATQEVTEAGSYPDLETSSSAERAADSLVLETKDLFKFPPGGIVATRREPVIGATILRLEDLSGTRLANNILPILEYIEENFRIETL